MGLAPLKAIFTQSLYFAQPKTVSPSYAFARASVSAGSEADRNFPVYVRVNSNVKPSTAVVAFTGIICLLGRARSSEPRTPRFQDYAAVEAFSGPVVKPAIDLRLEWKRSQTIRDAVTKIAKPNFAGRYIIAEWLYGAGAEMAVVDARTGAIFPSPFSTAGSKFVLPVAPEYKRPHYKLDSKLFVVPEACIKGKLYCYTYYFLWQGDAFKLIEKIRGKRNLVSRRSPNGRNGLPRER